MEKVQEELEDKVVEGTAGGGAVTATANGKKEILSLKISPDAVDPEDIETLEDLCYGRSQRCSQKRLTI